MAVSPMQVSWARWPALGGVSTLPMSRTWATMVRVPAVAGTNMVAETTTGTPRPVTTEAEVLAASKGPTTLVYGTRYLAPGVEGATSQMVAPLAVRQAAMSMPPTLVAWALRPALGVEVSLSVSRTRMLKV